MSVVLRGRKAVQAGALFLVAWMSLVSAGCGSNKDERPSVEPNAAQTAGTVPAGTALPNTKTTRAPLPPGATGTPADTFVRP